MSESGSVADNLGKSAATANAVLLGGMAVVAVAVGVAFHAQLSAPAWASGLASLLTFAFSAVLHLAMLRGRRVEELEREVNELWAAIGGAPTRAKSEKSGRPTARVAPPAPAVAKAEREAAQAPPAPQAPVASPAASGRSIAGRTAALLAASREASSAQSPAQPSESQAAAPVVAQSARAARIAPASRPAPVAPAPEHQPRSLAEETAMALALAEQDDPAEAKPIAPAPAIADPSPLARSVPVPVPSSEITDLSADEAPAPPAHGGDQRQLDPATIHEMVKKLAVEAHARVGGPVAGPQALEPEPEAAPQMGAADELPALEAADPESVEPTADAITQSVAALRAAADAMRAPETPTADTQARIAELAEALSADRVDVMLEPILGLRDQATRHYEVSISLKSADGAPLDLETDARELAGSGILPLIDLAKIARVADVARLLAERGKSGAVFADLAGESLADDDVLARIADIYGERAAITDQLVVALAQEDVRTFTPAHWAMVKELGGAGFRFALAHVTDLDMDFDELRGSGIQYVKLDAEVYLKGLPAAGEVTIPASDVYKFLADKGLSLIIEHISNETQLMRVVDCGALYGQGQLFGGPRVLKAQALARPAA